MLRNKLLEHILCEKYNSRVIPEKRCDCLKRIYEQTDEKKPEENKQQEKPTQQESPKLDLATLLLTGAIGAGELMRLKDDLMKFLTPPAPPKVEQDTLISAIPSMLHNPTLKVPHKQRIKEFGQATGQIIAS